jgi:hypothetical protein
MILLFAFAGFVSLCTALCRGGLPARLSRSGSGTCGFQNSGCCVGSNDTALAAQVSAGLSAACALAIKRTVCAQCAVDSALVFKSASGPRANMPTLCASTCAQLYADCATQVIANPPWGGGPANTLRLDAQYASSDAFCEFVQAADGTTCDAFSNELVRLTTRLRVGASGWAFRAGPIAGFQTLAFDASSWTSNQVAPLGFDSANATKQFGTVLPAASRLMLFRTFVNIFPSELPTVLRGVLRVATNDPAILYVNGVEVGRGSGTLNDEYWGVEAFVPLANLVANQNLIAIEVNSANANMLLDAEFAFELAPVFFTAVRPTPVPTPLPTPRPTPKPTPRPTPAPTPLPPTTTEASTTTTTAADTTTTTATTTTASETTSETTTETVTETTNTAAVNDSSTTALETTSVDTVASTTTLATAGTTAGVGGPPAEFDFLAVVTEFFTVYAPENIAIVAGAGAGILVCLILCIVLIVCLVRRRKSKKSSYHAEDSYVDLYGNMAISAPLVTVRPDGSNRPPDALTLPPTIATSRPGMYDNLPANPTATIVADTPANPLPPPPGGIDAAPPVLPVRSLQPPPTLNLPPAPLSLSNALPPPPQGSDAPPAPLRAVTVTSNLPDASPATPQQPPPQAPLRSITMMGAGPASANGPPPAFAPMRTVVSSGAQKINIDWIDDD